MISPFTGGNAHYKKEIRALEYRKESFSILYGYYVCEDTGEQFTTTDTDIINISQVHNQYRAKHGIPFVDEIRTIRTKYDLSAAKMSKILGFGPNLYREYEAGEMPTISNGKYIQFAKNPIDFIKILESSKCEFQKDEYQKILKKVEHELGGWDKHEEYFEETIFGTKTPNIYNGFRVPDFKKAAYIIQFFASKVQPYKTKLNKLLFYADFTHYCKTGLGITGITYNAIQHGPVPLNYNTLFDQIAMKQFVDIYYVYDGDFEGEQFKYPSKVELSHESGIFSKSEIEVLNLIVKKFGKMKTNEIVEASHDEAAWKRNIDSQKRISYEYGFYLNHVD